MANTEMRKIAIDEVVESAAAGVLRALDARAAAGGQGNAFQASNAHELVKSGFFVDFIIRAGGIRGPIDIVGGGSLAKGG